MSSIEQEPEPQEKTSKKGKKSESGKISVTAENIFPLIKKWLYTEKEIFLRELVSNGCDAMTKLQKLANIGEFTRGEEELKIDIRIDTVDKKIIFDDNGIGMTSDEVKKYISELAFSGATDFLNTYKEKITAEQMIGHFGLGFYSAFMVADRVEIQTLSYQEGAIPVAWTCTGSTDFQMSMGHRKTRGTEIILHMAEDSKDLLQESELKGLIKKYCQFLPYPISLNGMDQGINTHPLWKKSPSGLKDEDYQEFFKTLYPFDEAPLFWIHLNVDFPFHLQGVLYFPKLHHEFETSKSQISLYCNQVFVSNQVKDIIPEFLTVLKGVLDSPDIPLNVSRSQLQSDPQVRKITTHIIKKIADQLGYYFKHERENFDKFWEDIHPFVKYGALTDDKFWEQIKDIIIFKSTHKDHPLTTLKDYLERNEAKHPKKVFYLSEIDNSAGLLDLYQSQDIELLQLSTLIDSHFIQFLERKMDKISFQRIDSELDSSLKEDKQELVEGDSEKTFSQKVSDLFKGKIKKEKLKVQVEYLKSKNLSGTIVVPEFQRRMKEMQSMMGRNMPDFPEEHTLILNANHPLIKKVKNLGEGGEHGDEVELLCNHVYDLAKLGQKKMAPEDLDGFIQRSNQLLEKLANQHEKSTV